MRFKINLSIAKCNFFNYYTDSFSGKYCRQTFPKSNSVVTVTSGDTQTQSWLLWKDPKIQFVRVITLRCQPLQKAETTWLIWETRIPPVWKETKSHLFQVYSTCQNQRGLHSSDLCLVISPSPWADTALS